MLSTYGCGDGTTTTALAVSKVVRTRLKECALVPVGSKGALIANAWEDWHEELSEDFGELQDEVTEENEF